MPDIRGYVVGALWIGSNGEGMNRVKNGRDAGIRAADGLWDGTTKSSSRTRRDTCE
jgi:hypothetical protein